MKTFKFISVLTFATAAAMCFAEQSTGSAGAPASAGKESDTSIVSIPVPPSFVPGSRELPRFGPKPTPKMTDAEARKAEAAKATKIAAEARYKEMLDKMRKSTEEIAQLYGNPLFVQLFTNDHQIATEFEQRLQCTATAADLRKEIDELKQQREELRKDVALLDQEKHNQADRLVRQRSALDAVNKAVSGAQKAIEESVP